ncbi:DNA packaging terminase subunit 1 [Silurid herpesvirus 1]|nr:DNA packaging terminase subunit 1 [Silurid herpesvirus 1]
MDIVDKRLSEPVCINQQGYECLQHELTDGFFNRINLLAAGRALTTQKAQAEETLAKLRDPMTRALKLWELGVDAVTRMETECERICRDPGDRKLKRFCDMINAVFSLMVDRGGMRLEVFQVELMRGFFIGIAANQFRDDLFKYKHIILDLLGLATPDIVTFNPLCPSLAVSREIDRLFDEYGKNYTLALAPRQCGKTTIMVILLAAMISYLDIEIVVQAQHKTMCETLYDRVELVLHEIQHSAWYPEENRIVTIKGTTETREFIYDPAYKGTTRVHFLSSSPNAARGQIPDFVLIDEAAFVNPASLLSLLPLLAVKNRKQIHISSHIPKSWVTRVETIMGSDGKRAFHVINQRFKCEGHAHLPGMMCPCSAIFCPTHIDLNESIQELINNITPGGCEIELTGGDGAGLLKKDVAQPFSEELIRQFLANTIVELDEVRRVFIAVDPTYANGTQSSFGVCTFAELKNGQFQILAVEEVAIGEMRAILMHFYTTILLAHVDFILGILSRKDIPIIFLPEQNTFMFDNETLWRHLYMAAEQKFGIKLFVYKQFSRNGGAEIGKLVSGNKASMVIKAHNMMETEMVGRLMTVASFGEIIKGLYLHNQHTINKFYRAEHTKTITDARSANLNPQDLDDFKKLTPGESADYIFRYLGGGTVAISPGDTGIFEAGTALVTRLGCELMAIELKSVGKTIKVTTGGKRYQGGGYSRDDLFAAFLLGTSMIGRPDDATDGVFVIG